MTAALAGSVYFPISAASIQSIPFTLFKESDFVAHKFLMVEAHILSSSKAAHILLELT
jgi:hypothetical protein